MSSKHIERVFNASYANLNEQAAQADPAVMLARQQQSEADRLRGLNTSMTIADVIQRILLHYSERDYFRLLELAAPEADALGRVTWSTPAVEVSKAYRRLSVLVHPDKNPGADARKAFEALNEAHRVLKDPNRLGTILKEHEEAALARRRQREAGATLEERMALNAAQSVEAAALQKQEGAAFQAEIVRQLKEKKERMALKRQRAARSRRREASSDEEGHSGGGSGAPAPPPGAAGRAAAGSDSDEDGARRRRLAQARRRKPSTLL